MAGGGARTTLRENAAHRMLISCTRAKAEAFQAKDFFLLQGADFANRLRKQNDDYGRVIRDSKVEAD